MRELRLWDGSVYDRDEVARVAPWLVEHAEKYPILGERIERRPPKIGCLREVMSSVYLVLVEPFALIAAIGILLSHAPLAENFLLQGLCEAAIWSAMFLSSLLTRGRAVYSMKPECVWVDAGIVHVERGGKIRVVPLRECAWFRGFAYQDLEATDPPLSPRILIWHPDLKEGRHKGPTRWYVSFGTTDEMRRLWESFLTLAGVQRLRDTSRWSGVSSSVAYVSAFTGTRIVGDLLTIVLGSSAVTWIAVYVLPWIAAGAVHVWLRRRHHALTEAPAAAAPPAPQNHEHVVA